MIAFFVSAVMAALAQSNMAPVNVHYQALPAFQIYTTCFSERFSADPRGDSDDQAQVRQANADALAGCRQVRDEQLARALREVTDYRLHGGSRVRTHAAVRAAFERYGTDLIVESVVKLPEQADAAGGSPPPADSAAAPAPSAEDGVLVRNPALSAGAGPVPYFHIPPLIAPAVAPYLRCLLDSRGVEQRSASGERRRPSVPEGTDCSSRRERAARNANRILRDRRLGTSTERAALIEATLENVERFVDTPAPDWLAPPDEKPGAAPVEPAEEQALEDYAACLRSHRTDVETARTALSSTRRAIAACSGQRRSMVARGTAVLSDVMAPEDAAREAEQRVQLIDALVPAMLFGRPDRPIRIVPTSECPSELKDADQCLE